MSKHTLEQVLEALINKEDDRASELLHQYFVSKGKSIYEELSQFDEAAEEELDESEEEEIEEGIGGAADQDFEDEIIADEAELEDEQLFGEAEEEDMAADEPAEDEATADLAMGEPEGEEMPADKEELKMKADEAMDELKAIFAELMGDAGGEEMPAEEPTEESFEAFGESTMPKPVSKPTPGDNGQNTKSPVASSKRVDGNGAAAVDFTGEADKGMATPGSKTDDMGNVNKVGNAKAPAPKAVSVPKMNSDTASNKTSPVAKS